MQGDRINPEWSFFRAIFFSQAIAHDLHFFFNPSETHSTQDTGIKWSVLRGYRFFTFPARSIIFAYVYPNQTYTKWLLNFCWGFFFAFYRRVSVLIFHARLRECATPKTILSGKKKHKTYNIKPEAVKEDWNWHLASLAGGRVQPEIWECSSEWGRGQTEKLALQLLTTL